MLQKSASLFAVDRGSAVSGTIMDKVVKLGSVGKVVGSAVIVGSVVGAAVGEDEGDGDAKQLVELSRSNKNPSKQSQIQRDWNRVS
jgi:hypothetical protein